MKTSDSPTKEKPPNVPSLKLFWLGIGVICAAVITLSLFSQQLLKRKSQTFSSLPKISHLKNDLETVERSGKLVKLSELDGKVRVFAYIYTVCPHGCAAIIGEMLKLEKTFGERTDFQQVSVSVVPERDSPAMLSAYAEGIGLKPQAPWWFLTGERQKLEGFMTESLKLDAPEIIPEEERLNPLDLYAHDLRIVVVDRQGFVRGYYAVFHPQAEIASLMKERLHQDVQRLLDDPNL